MKLSKAPWTEEQIERLDKRQQDLTKHPYTCGVCGKRLTAYRDGWHCDYCNQYIQTWAHGADVRKP